MPSSTQAIDYRNVGGIWLKDIVYPYQSSYAYVAFPIGSHSYIVSSLRIKIDTLPEGAARPRFYARTNSLNGDLGRSDITNLYKTYLYHLLLNERSYRDLPNAIMYVSTEVNKAFV